MNNAKIITRPFKHGEPVSKSRHVTGINQWARSSKTVGAIMFVLGWFTIPFEVVFRKDFGQRWFTPISFYVGVIIIIVFMSLGLTYGSVMGHLHDYLPFFPSNSESESGDKNFKNYIFMLIFSNLYLYIGLYHLFKIKWRNQANISLHSFDDGTSRLRWVASFIAETFNLLFVPFLWFYWILIPRKQRRGKPFPKLIVDLDVFTNVFFEPALVFYMACVMYDIISFYLFLSGFAMLIHAHWKEMARKTKMLDFQDSKVEAELMRELKRKITGENGPLPKHVANAKKAVIQPLVMVQYPKLGTIIEELNNERARR